MRNFAQPGNTVTLTAPRNLQSGDGVFIGTAFGVSATAVASGGKAEIAVEGCFAFKRATGADRAHEGGICPSRLPAIARRVQQPAALP